MAALTSESFPVPGSPRGALLVHGYTGSPATLRSTAKALQTAGWDVHVPVLPGHGIASAAAWQGVKAEDWWNQVCLEAQAFRRERPAVREIAIVGLSMGALLALHAAVHAGVGVDHLAMLAPVFTTRDRRLPWTPFLAPFVKDLRKKKPKRLAWPLDPATDALNTGFYWKKDWTVPANELWRVVRSARALARTAKIPRLFAAFARNDETVDVEDAERHLLCLARNAGAFEYLAWRDGQHELTVENRKDEVNRALVGFLAGGAGRRRAQEPS